MPLITRNTSRPRRFVKLPSTWLARRSAGLASLGLGLWLIASPTQATSLLDSGTDLDTPGIPSSTAPVPTETIMTASHVNPAANPLLGETWNRRPLVLIAPNEHDPDLQRQRDRLNATRDEMQQRNMTLYTLMGMRGLHDGVPMSIEEVRALRAAMQLREGASFTVILIGKDGGKKMQLEGFVAPDQIYQVIDSMPMRQREASQAARKVPRKNDEHTSPAPLSDEDWQWEK